MRKRLPILIAFALLSFPLAGVAGAQQGRLIFSGTAELSFDLFSVEPDGSGLTNLTLSPGQEWDPALAPDGTMIAFSRRMAGHNSSDIWVMSADGSGQDRLNNEVAGRNDRDPAWSPDGDWLAWTRSTGGLQTSQLWLMRPNGTGKKPITDDQPGIYDHSPAWSPDGERIAFVSNRGKKFPDLWVLNLSTGTQQRLTNTDGQIEGQPAWSPDGKRVAYECRSAQDPTAICVVSANGGVGTKLTHTTGYEAQPAWSPDGGYLVYTRAPVGGGDKDLATVRADGTGQRIVTSSPQIEFDPAWGVDQAASPSSAFYRVGATGNQATSSSAGTVASPVVRHTSNVAPGVKFIRMRYEGSNIFVVRVKPHHDPTVDVALGDFAGRERVTAVAKEHNAVAAINGDFPLLSGVPTQPFAQDGDLKTTSFSHSHNFAIRQDESLAYLDRPVEMLEVGEQESGDALTFDRWNRGPPTAAEISAFSPPGGSEEQPPRYSCSVRLDPAGGRRWVDGHHGIVRPYEVDATRCSAPRMARLGGLVLSAQPGTDRAFLLETLRPGEKVAIRWYFHSWTGVADSVGGFPVLMDGGQVVAEDCGTEFCDRHPRTGIGVVGVSTVLLVVADGRSTESAGLTMLQFARLFQALEARDAVNLDGGGSSTMVVKGKIRNEPSDGQERAVCCAVLVLPGKDHGEHIGAPSSATSSAPSSVSSIDGGSAPFLDPGSSGGMLDAMARGAFGAEPSTLTAEMRSAVRVYRDRTGSS